MCTTAGISVDDPLPSLSICRDWSLSQLTDLASLVVDDLSSSEEKSWTQIDQQYAIDPAAQITTKDLS